MILQKENVKISQINMETWCKIKVKKVGRDGLGPGLELRTKVNPYFIPHSEINIRELKM